MEGRTRLTILLTASLCLQLVTIDMCLGMAPNKKHNGLPTVRKRYMSYGPPIGSYIYIMGHLNPDELEEHGLSVSTRSSPSNNIDPKKQPTPLQQPDDPRALDTVAGHDPPNMTSKFTNKSNKVKRSKEGWRRWMNMMKRSSVVGGRMNLDEEDGQSYRTNSIDPDDDYGIDDNDIDENYDNDGDYRDLRLMFPKMNILKFFDLRNNESPDGTIDDEMADQTFGDTNQRKHGRHGSHGNKYRKRESRDNEQDKNDIIFKYSNDN